MEENVLFNSLGVSLNVLNKYSLFPQFINCVAIKVNSKTDTNSPQISFLEKKMIKNGINIAKTAINTCRKAFIEINFILFKFLKFNE